MAQRPESAGERGDSTEGLFAHAHGHRVAALGLLMAITLVACATPSQPPIARSGTATGTPSVDVAAVPVLVEATPEAEPALPAAPPAAPAATSSAPAPAVSTPRPVRPPAQALRVRIPALSVDAPVLQMGIDTAGVMEVPQNSSTVAWYGFSAAPGSPGNAVMAAHVTWGGARAVFNQLSALRPGDVIDVRTGDGDLRYVVQRSYLVRPEEADIPAIVGPRDGPQTLTLITCGGSFDSSVREYDHRVIVYATRA